MGCNDCFSVGNGSQQLEQSRYFSRQLVTADLLTQDQDYYREKRRLHNRLLHGWGIVCGLEVKANSVSGPPLTGAPLNVTICPGYALSPQGDEIYVPTEVQFDLGQCIAGQGQSVLCTSPCAPVVPGAVNPESTFYIAIKYAQCLSNPVRVTPLGCGCDDTACEYSRIREGFEVTCLGSLPDSYPETHPELPVLCSAVKDTGVVACPLCPDSPWIVLATVRVIGNVPKLKPQYRRVLLSTAVMQEYLRAECVSTLTTTPG